MPYLKKIQQFVLILGVIGSMQFLFCSTFAMFKYNGGTLHKPSLTHYSFTRNYFSDLGRTKTFRGKPNQPAQTIFSNSLQLSGAIIILYFICLPFIFKRNIFMLLAAFSGIFAGWNYIGIATVPWNENYWGHVNYVRYGFLSFLIMSIFYALAILKEKGFPNKYAGALCLFAIVLLLQILVMFFGPRAYRSDNALFIQVISQKIVVYAELLILLYTSWGTFQFFKSKPYTSP